MPLSFPLHVFQEKKIEACIPGFWHNNSFFRFFFFSIMKCGQVPVTQPYKTKFGSITRALRISYHYFIFHAIYTGNLTVLSSW